MNHGSICPGACPCGLLSLDITEERYLAIKEAARRDAKKEGRTFREFDGEFSFGPKPSMEM